MTFDAVAYWQQASTDPTHQDHEARFVRTNVYAEQERALMATLGKLDPHLEGPDCAFRSILEVGCGFGRITKLVSERWPEAKYTAIDLSAERLASAQEKAPGVEYVQTTVQGYRSRRKWDLVLAVEVLMHVPPDEIEATVERVCGFSRRHVVSVDWNTPLGKRPIAPHNALFDYPALYGIRLVSVEQIGLQAIYVADVR